VPAAVNCFVRPVATLGLAGDTVIAVSVAAVTVSVVLPDIEPDVAVTTVEPTAMPVARPPEFMVATDVDPDDQVTNAVISTDVPLEYVPVAMNCLVSPV